MLCFDRQLNKFLIMQIWESAMTSMEISALNKIYLFVASCFFPSSLLRVCNCNLNFYNNVWICSYMNIANWFKNILILFLPFYLFVFPPSSLICVCDCESLWCASRVKEKKISSAGYIWKCWLCINNYWLFWWVLFLVWDKGIIIGHAFYHVHYVRNNC